MEGLLAALALLISVISGSPHASDAGSMDLNISEIAINSTPNVSLAPHSVIAKMEKCDKIRDNDERNLCYAKASSDSFFCDRIEDEALSKECKSKISNH